MTAFEAALVDWCNLSRRLQAEKENQQIITNTMSQAWVGETQRDFENIYKDLVTTGLYQQTAEIVERIYRIQYDLLPKMIAQMARCEKMTEQLEQDDYIPPYLGGYGYYNDGQLALDEDYVSSCNVAATEAVVQATEARNLLYRAMDACGGLIDFGAEREALEAGYRKVKRIENFQLEFNKYVTEVNEIEEELIRGFRAVIAADPDPTNQKWNSVLQNLNSKRNNVYALQQLSSVGISAGVATILETANVLDMEYIISILEKPLEEWTMQDAEIVARVYTDAVEKRDVSMLNAIAESLLVEQYTDPVLKNLQGFVVSEEAHPTDESQRSPFYYSGAYIAGLDADKCNMLLTYINPQEHGEAYYTLTRLRNMTFQKEIKTQDSKYEIYDSYIMFSQDELGQLHAEMTLDYEIYNQDRLIEQLQFIASDLYEEAGEAAIKNMEALHFSTEEIVNVLSGICTDKDKEFVYELLSSNTTEDYAELFKTSPKLLSITGQSALTTYACGLYNNGFILDEEGIISNDQTHNFEQLTAFLNGILYKEPTYETQAIGSPFVYETVMVYNPDYTQDYLSILAACMEECLTINGNEIYNSYNKVSEDVITSQYKMNNLYSLFLSLEQMEINYKKSWDIGKVQDIYSAHGYEISNLELDNSTVASKPGENIRTAMFSYIATMKHGENSGREYKVALSAQTPSELESLEEIIKYNEAAKKARYSELKAVANATVSTISIFNPYVGLGVSGMKLLNQSGDLSEVIEEVSSVTEDYDGLSNSISIVGNGVAACEQVLKDKQEAKDAYAEILDDWYESGVYVEIIGGKNFVVGKGLYDPNVIIKKAMLYNEGFSFLCAEESDKELGNTLIEESKGNNDTHSMEAMDQENERTVDEKIHVMKILWNGPKTDEEKEILENLRDDQFNEYVGNLNDIIFGSNKETITLKIEEIKDVEINFKAYEVNMK